MFTGIVEDLGRVVEIARRGDGARLTLTAHAIAAGVKLGESIAVNGCCLTATEIAGTQLGFDLLNETLARTNLGDLHAGSSVNLERALAAGGRLGGHFVQGHIDGAARIVAFEKTAADHRLEIELPPEFARYVAFKGSIAVNGISLTVAEVHRESFVVWIIPHTLTVTNLGDARAGDRVNLEFDLLAKYVERLLGTR